MTFLWPQGKQKPVEVSPGLGGQSQGHARGQHLRGGTSGGLSGSRSWMERVNLKGILAEAKACPSRPSGYVGWRGTLCVRRRGS